MSELSDKQGLRQGSQQDSDQEPGQEPGQQKDIVLIVEDDRSLRELLTEEMQDAGYIALEAGDTQQALAVLADHAVNLIISDLRLPGASGLELLATMHQQADSPGFIIITAFGTVEQAVDALKQGADDFLTKPIKLDHLRIAAERVIQRRKLHEELTRYRKLIGDSGFHGMLGRSSAMQRLSSIIRMVARAEGPVLITGESGTGKELVARALHEESPRKNGPFVAVNCAGIPPALLESELFGHTAQAFTGARKARTGLFAEADGGSLLLDEIGEMPMEMQAKLLRILEDGRIRPVGSNQETQLDVRIIAATNRDLDEEVRNGRFREDLYFRLQTFAMQVPPLRERGDDIELLAAQFIGRLNLQLNRDIQGISDAALARLRAHDYPGNVRELASAIERAVTFCQGSDIDLQDLPERLQTAAPPTTGDEASKITQQLLTGHGSAEPGALPALQDIELAYIQLVLKRLGGNKRQAAAALGIGRRTLYRRLGIDE